jgi:hypothetical protein
MSDLQNNKVNKLINNGKEQLNQGKEEIELINNKNENNKINENNTENHKNNEIKKYKDDEDEIMNEEKLIFGIPTWKAFIIIFCIITVIWFCLALGLGFGLD